MIAEVFLSMTGRRRTGSSTAPRVSIAPGMLAGCSGRHASGAGPRLWLKGGMWSPNSSHAWDAGRGCHDSNAV